MSGTEGTPARRARLHRAAREDGVPELEALLRDVDALRLGLETDLTLAASAVEAGEPGIAADILGADRDALARFEASALDHLGALEAAEPVTADADRRRSWLPAHSGSLLVAAAMVGVLAGVVPQAISRHPEPSTSVAANASLERLQQLVLDGNATEIRAASAELHEQLASVVALAGTNPAAAQNALILLTYEQTAISHSADRGVLGDVLRQSEALETAIRDALPPRVRVSVPPVVPVLPTPDAGQAAAAQSPSPAPKASATPKATSSPKASASPSAGPSSSPSPSPQGYPLPTPPLAP
jgi:hypothetical protein